MVIVKLIGGLGNQMFQYALGRHLSVINDCPMKLDLSELLDRRPRKNFVFRDYDLDIFNIPVEKISYSKIPLWEKICRTKLVQKLRLKKVFLKINELLYWLSPKSQTRIVKEKRINFDQKILSLHGNLYLDGYWQSEKYFKEIENIIRNEFSFTRLLDDKAKQLAEEISGSNSVCVNVRRGDFVNNATHGVCDVSYYKKAKEIMDSKISNPKYFIFSDDIDWCKDNLNFFQPSFFVGHEYAGDKFSSYLNLMSLGHHFIIPNSSFAWWAAWLSKNEEKIIITPNSWYKIFGENTFDIVPNKWIKI